MAEAGSDPKLEIAHVLTMDVVEYSTLLITEQSRVMAELTRIVRSTARFRRAEAEGKLVRLPTGDGMALVFFNDPEAPIECAMEIRAAIKNQPEIRLRMGIHSGPVNEVVDVNDRSNVAGAGIDLAQRVMDCGDAGHILVSKRVADDLAPYSRWNPHLHELGECEVKHGRKISLANFYTDEVGNPQTPKKCELAKEKQRTRSTLGDLARKRAIIGAVLALLIALVIGLVVFSRSAAPKKMDHQALSVVQMNNKSIAVLPFENRSEDKANAYFADGIQDEILTRLAKIADLKVISRTSTQRYKSAPANLSDIGKQLGVAHLLEGSVQKSGDRVRVNVQLIKATDDSHLWAETFDRRLTDVFAVESEVATAIADKLSVKLTGSEQRVLATKPTENVAAYDAYLHGLAIHLAFALDKLLDAEKYFQRAVDLDQGFALAWARLAIVHSHLYYIDFDTTPARREAARLAAETAMKLAPDSGEAYLALGYYRFHCERNIDLAAQAFANARQRLPNDPDVLVALGTIDSHDGRDQDALIKLSQALQLDPRNASLIRRKAVFESFFRRFADAQATADRALEIAPEDSRSIALKAEIYQAAGDLGKANQVLARLPEQPVFDKIEETSSQMRQLMYQRHYDAVISALEPIVAKPDPSLGIKMSDYHALVAAAQKLSGDAEGARATYTRARDFLLDAIKKTGGTQGYVHAMLGLMYAGLGEKELALKEGNAALAMEGSDTLLAPAAQEILARIEVQVGENNSALARLPQLLSARYHSWFYFVPLTPAHLRLDPVWDPLRNDPQFQKLIQEVKP